MPRQVYPPENRLNAKEVAFLGLLLAVAAAVFLSGCSTFSVEWKDGTRVSSSGAPLLSRKDGFTVTHQWTETLPNGDLIPHSVTVTRNTDENASAQAKALEYAFGAGKAAAAAGGAP